MSTPLEPIRYNIEDGKQFLEMLSVPDLFLDGDYNTNTWLLWQFLGKFIEDSFGPVRLSGLTVNLVGTDVVVSPTKLWFKYFYINRLSSTTLDGARVIGTEQYLYLKITHKRLTISDDPGTDPVTIRQNINGNDYSRPNQYVYDSTFIVDLSPNLISTIGNLPNTPDIYYIKVAKFNSNESIENYLNLFDKVASQLDIAGIKGQIQTLLDSVTEIQGNIVTINESLTNIEGEISDLQDADTFNAKLNAQNIFQKTNIWKSSVPNYDGVSSALTLTDGNIFTFTINSDQNLQTISNKGVGTVIKLVLRGSGNLTLINGPNLVLPGGKNIILQTNDWVEFTQTVAGAPGTWELSGNSTRVTIELDALKSALSTNVLPGGIIEWCPVPGFPLSSLFDSTGLGIPGTRAEAWMICNGVSHDIPNYGTITPPDKRGRFSVGAINNIPAVGAPALHPSINPANSDVTTGNIIPNYDLGATGGFPNHQLIIDQMAEHDHLMPPNMLVYGNIEGGIQGSPDWITNNSLRTGKTGGNKYHNNLPPYYATLWLMLWK